MQSSFILLQGSGADNNIFPRYTHSNYKKPISALVLNPAISAPRPFQISGLIQSDEIVFLQVFSQPLVESHFLERHYLHPLIALQTTWLNFGIHLRALYPA
jgi:hypothetical protein